MVNFSNLTNKIKKLMSTNLISIVLFGSVARGDFIKSSDIDILLISNKNCDENLIEKELLKINSKIQIMILTKDEFKKRVIDFNHQLITLFLDGKVLYDKNKFYYKMENLFLALNRKKDFKLRVKNRIVTLEKLRRVKAFI